MTSPTTGLCPDFTSLPEGQLIQQILREKDSLAREELQLRYRDIVHDWTMQLARKSRLCPEDTEDEQQDAQISFLDAIARFDPEKGCCFKTWLFRFLTGRHIDFVRRIVRHKKRQGKSLHALMANRDGNETIAAVRMEKGPPCDNRDGDPADLAEANDLQACLHKIIEQSHGRTRDVFQGMLAGKSLKKIGLDLNVSYDDIKRFWRCLRNKLRKQLGGPGEGR
jgi:RNA polymerase sigma factor (sigma-70 family)